MELHGLGSSSSRSRAGSSVVGVAVVAVPVEGRLLPLALPLLQGRILLRTLVGEIGFSGLYAVCAVNLEFGSD